MTSIAKEPYNINTDPFIIKAREAIKSLNLECGTSYLETQDSKYSLISFDTFYITFPAKFINESILQIIEDTFSNKCDFKPIRNFLKGDEYLFFVTFHENLKSIDTKFKPFFWDKEKTEAKRNEFIVDLDKTLINYFYQNFMF